MALDIDPTRPFRTPDRLVALVRAVLAAEPTDEAVWLEWKRPLDFTRPEGQFSVARQILGFANRRPDVAAPWAGGHAYVIVGAEPGSLAGIGPIDPAVLESWIGPWVGGGNNAPRWHPAWVDVDGRSVLVVDVEPSQTGDPAFPLRKAHGKSRAGDLLVRHLGSIDPAGPEDVDALSARAGGSPRRIAVALVVDPEVAPLQRAGYADEDMDRWVEQRRERLLRCLPPKEPAKPAAVDVPGVSSASAAALSLASKMGESLSRPDERTEDQYRTEVEEHLGACRERLVPTALALIAEQKRARLQLRIGNRTDMNLPEVEVVLHIDGRVWGIEEDDEDGGLPAEPRRFGERRSILGDRAMPGAFTIPDLGAAHRAFQPRPIIKNTGSVTVTFTAVDLRPREEVTLDSVDLLIAQSGTGVLSATWRATSSGADGLAEGKIEIPLHPEPVNLVELLPQP